MTDPTWRAVALAIAVASASAAPASGEELKRGPGYPGALFLYQMKEVAVVYPAGPGQDAAMNRRSADARARFLHEVHGVAARVVADTEATEVDRRGNLLVLGWANTLLDVKGAPRPYERRADAVVLLGEPVGDPGDDLLIFHRSPFAPDRYVVFWSRIDPERDRFMVLPRVGSDWAVLRDYRAVRQGMFVPSTTWPPSRDPQAEGDHEAKLDEAGGRFASVSTEHFTVHYETDRVAQAELDTILKTREAAFAKVVATLGDPAPAPRIDLWVYDDEGSKKELTGVGDPVHTIPLEREIHMTRRAARSGSAREETHLVARARLGPAYLSAAYEGLGISVDGSWRGRELDVEGALMSEAGRVPGAADLFDEEHFRAAIEAGSLPAAGLFFSWLRATQPPAVLSRVYGLVEGSPAALSRALGRSVADADAEFRGWVKERGAARHADVVVVKAESEAKERLAAGDYGGVAAALEKAHAAKPADPQILFNLASALMRTERLADAEGAFRKVLALPLGPSDSRFRIFAHYQIGRVLDIQGRREEALAAYRKVLEMPDEFDAHRLAQERIASPATREQLE